MIVDRMPGARVLNGAARVGTLVVAGALASGCYAYTTPHLGESERLTGRQVQATLTDSGSVVLAAKVGPAVEQLRGSVVAEDLTSLSVAMDESVHRDGTGAPWRQEVVLVPRPLIREIDIRGLLTLAHAVRRVPDVGGAARGGEGVPEERRGERCRDWADGDSGRSVSEVGGLVVGPAVDSRLTAAARAVASEPIAS